jgi:serine protease Do
MTVVAVTDLVRNQLGLGDDVEGLAVTGIDDASDAFAKGIRIGDVISEVGQERIGSPKEMRARIDAAEQAGRNSILLLVRRDGAPRFVALNLSN